MWLSRGDSNPGLFLSPRFQPPLHSVGSSLPRWRALVQGLGRFWNLCEDVPGGGGGGVPPAGFLSAPVRKVTLALRAGGPGCLGLGVLGGSCG